MAVLAGCDLGNSAEGKLALSGGAKGELNRSLHTELLKWRKPVEVRIAPDSTFDLQVDDPATGGRAVVVSGQVEPEIASVQLLDSGVLRINATKAGMAALRIRVEPFVEDWVPLVVEAPNVLELTQGCPDAQPYWAGHPAVVRFAFSHEPTAPDAHVDGRIYGDGYHPVTSAPDQSVIATNGFEWVLSGLPAPGSATVRGTSPVEDASLAMEFKEPPKITGVALLSVSAGSVLGPEVQGPRGTTHVFRAFPVGEGDQPMCNTTAAARVDSKSDGCSVRAVDADSTFGQTATSKLGLFEVTADPSRDRCTFNLVMQRDGWQFAGDAPIQTALTTVFFSTH
ncbi:MAG: hypothetical protein R3E66_05885 [bacterium]